MGNLGAEDDYHIHFANLGRLHVYVCTYKNIYILDTVHC